MKIVDTQATNENLYFWLDNGEKRYLQTTEHGGSVRLEANNYYYEFRLFSEEENLNKLKSAIKYVGLTPETAGKRVGQDKEEREAEKMRIKGIEEKLIITDKAHCWEVRIKGFEDVRLIKWKKVDDDTKKEIEQEGYYFQDWKTYEICKYVGILNVNEEDICKNLKAHRMYEVLEVANYLITAKAKTKAE